MATYSGVVLSRHKTLVASTVDTVVFSTNFASAEVVNRATSGGGIYFTTDGTTPTVAGDDTYWLGPGSALPVPLGASDTVKLISATADDYSVAGVNG